MVFFGFSNNFRFLKDVIDIYIYKFKNPNLYIYLNKNIKIILIF